MSKTMKLGDLLPNPSTPKWPMWRGPTARPSAVLKPTKPEWTTEAILDGIGMARLTSGIISMEESSCTLFIGPSEFGYLPVQSSIKNPFSKKEQGFTIAWSMASEMAYPAELPEFDLLKKGLPEEDVARLKAQWKELRKKGVTLRNPADHPGTLLLILSRIRYCNILVSDYRMKLGQYLAMKWFIPPVPPFSRCAPPAERSDASLD